MTELSILIPARNEQFLARTIADILEHSEADTEIIAVLDGAWAEPPIPDHPRVTLVYHPESIGQRAATNEAARLARGEYVMKCDAHCTFGQGFDRILLEDVLPDWTIVPLMRNLHAFDWVCEDCGHRRYQGKAGLCPECGGQEERDIVWRAKPSPNTTAMRFGPDLKFQYWGGYKKRQRGELVETMSLLGACWMLSKERYFALNICDEGHGSWGQQGTEVACKTWLSGGKLICDKRTWFAHLFRTQGGDFGFPYPLSKRQTDTARDYSRSQFIGGAWQGKYPLSWLIEKFWPIEGWTDEDLAALKAHESARRPSKAILYYTDNRLDPQIMDACQRKLTHAGIPIVCVSLEPMAFGDQNIVVDGERGPLTLHRQILAGLQAIDADVVFLAEHDVLYNPSHFEFTPERADRFYYNTNVWKVWMDGGPATWTDGLQQTSGLCARRDLLLEFYEQRTAKIERDGFDRHYEPGPKTGPYRTMNWQSATCNVDIRHGQNATRSKRSPDEFRNPRYALGWRESDYVPGWGTVGEVVRMVQNGKA